MSDPFSTPKYAMFVVALAALAFLAGACGNGEADDDAAEQAPARGSSTVESPVAEAEAELTEDEMADGNVTDDETADGNGTDEDMAEDETVEDEMADDSLKLTITAAEYPPLDGDAHYEAWLIVAGEPVSVGTFASFDAGVELDVSSTEGFAELAAAVVVTIEVDDDPAPADTRVLAGALRDGRAELTTTDASAIGTDFAEAAGEYILATPTDGTGSPENERSGVWWTELPRAQSLFLPVLPPGWIYEGWQRIDGVAVTTGTFTEPFGAADNGAPFSGPDPGPPLVGEDFLINAPPGLVFPVDLRGTEVVVTVEPFPDTRPDPFPLVVLRGIVPGDAVDHTPYPVDNVAAEMGAGVAILGS